MNKDKLQAFIYGLLFAMVLFVALIKTDLVIAPRNCCSYCESTTTAREQVQPTLDALKEIK